MIALLPLAAWADQITLKNGDRLSGSVLKSDNKTLSMKTELAGTVSVPWDAVVRIESTEPLNVGLPGGQMVSGIVRADNGRIEVQTADAGTVAASLPSVLFIRSKTEQAVYELEEERYRNPRLVDLWTGFADLGFSKVQGNAESSNLAVSANATRATSRDKIAVTFTSLNASASTLGEELVTANAMRGGVNYSLNVTEKLFAFGAVDLEFDEFQRLDLRFNPTGGLGYRLIGNERTLFDLLGGASLNREFFSNGLRRTSGEVLMGEEYVLKISEVTSLREKLVFFPNATDGGNYRINFDASAVTALSRWLAWQITVSDRYLSNPVSGRKKNDVLFTTGFRFTFAR